MTEVTDEQLKYMELYAKALERIAELEYELELIKFMIAEKDE